MPESVNPHWDPEWQYIPLDDVMGAVHLFYALTKCSAGASLGNRQVEKVDTGERVIRPSTLGQREFFPPESQVKVLDDADGGCEACSVDFQWYLIR